MEKSYNKWFTDKVEEALNSDKPTKDQEDVMKTLRDNIDERVEKPLSDTRPMVSKEDADHRIQGILKTKQTEHNE